MLYVRTFGGLAVELDNVLGQGAAQQRKTLALIALLTRAAGRGVSRDKLTAYLWPDSDREHARGLLKQACYALRRDLAAPDLFLGGSELRLNPALITSDVELFQVALAEHDPARAISLYVGPFLDGFYVEGADEFQRWVEAERDLLRRRACKALETLATRAAAGGDDRGSVEYWRRLWAVDPLNSRIALGLITALVAVGDRCGALDFARRQERRVREELDVGPDADIARLTERLRGEFVAPGPAAAPSQPRGRVPPVSLQTTPPILWTDPDAPERDNTPGSEQREQTVPAAGRSEASDDRAPIRGGRDAVVSPRPDTSTPLRRWPTQIPRSAAALTTFSVIVLAAAAWFASGVLRDAGAEAGFDPTRLVVLPFTNLGPAEDDYFADGITGEITTRLAAIERLRVIGGTSANPYKETEKTIEEIGAELRVGFVLRGTLRWQKAGAGPARVRVVSQLVSTADGAQRWGEVYDEPLDEIFRVQSEIAQKVVRALDITLRDPQRRALEAAPTSNLEAYDYYLRGIDYDHRGSEERTSQAALRMYEKAVELDPSFALAYALLSRRHSHLYWFHYDHTEDRLAKARAAVDRAFELDPTLPEAHRALGAYYFLGRLDYARALNEFAIVEASRPNDGEVFLARAVLRTRQGDFPRAIEDFERALELDPRSAMVANNAAQGYELVRDFARAEPLRDRAIALSPDWAFPYYGKARLYLRWDGNTRRARDVLDDALRAGVAETPLLFFAGVLVEIFDRRYAAALNRVASGGPEVIQDQFRFIPRTQLLAECYGLLKRHDLATAYYDSSRSFVLRKLQDYPDDSRLHSALGIAYAGLGRKQEAIAAGEKAVELLPVAREAYRGYYRLWDLARIYAMVGDDEAAIDRLEHLLSIPGNLTFAWLRLDPTWDSLRAHPRFQHLATIRGA